MDSVRGGEMVSNTAIVLAAGFGTRMKSRTHKVLHDVCGKPMIAHILDQLERLSFDQVIVVVGQQREAVEAAVANRADIAVQTEQLGTGHAVQAALPILKSADGATVVLYGDAPLIRAETIQQLLDTRAGQDAAAVVLTATLDDPSGLGRVCLDAGGMLHSIVEEKDASEAERRNKLTNTGIYAYRTDQLIRAIGLLKNHNTQQEYYLTDTLGILREQGQAVYALEVTDPEEIASVNDRVQLAAVESILRRRICQAWMRAGVTIIDPEHTYIGLDVQLERDVTLLPGTILEGRTVIGEDCIIGPNTRLDSAVIRRGATVEYSIVLDSEIGEDSSVGPFTYVRPHSRVGARVKVGDFVEVKKSTIGDDSKVSHLAYIGDADIGRRVNVGCGVITVNYDGEHKHLTTVGDDSFIGSNTNLIAPVTVGEGAYVCAGSTVTDNVPDDGFAIARERQVTKENYVAAWKNRR